LGVNSRLPVVAPSIRAGTPGHGLRLGAAETAALSSVRRRWPDDVSHVCARADAALEGRFALLGYEGLSFGHPVDWHLDPLRGKRTTLVHWTQVPYLDVERVGDHKLVWELNRHNHFVTLAQAACLTGDEHYSLGLKAQWHDWTLHNPPARGMNWASSLEVAMRAIHWLWAARLLRCSDGDHEAFLKEMALWLAIHGSHIERYMSTYFSPNTHLTGEALGLLYLGCWLEDSKTTARWRQVGWRILVEQLVRQVYPDGAYFEQSTWYQRYTVDFYLHAWLLAVESQMPLPPGYRERLERAADVLLHVRRPDGSAPLIGDDDGGQLIGFDSASPDDFSDTLALAGVVMGRSDLCAAARARSSLFWLLGESGIERFESLLGPSPELESRAFEHGGYYCLRDGGSPRSSLMVIDAGRHGALSGGHSHADALAIDLSVEGAPLFVDPGTYSYVGSEREWFRSTGAHNTAEIDGVSSSHPEGMFRWSGWARTTVECWLTKEWVSGLSASHDGYERLSDPLVHHRVVLFLRDGYWLVVDRFAARLAHRIKLRFQAAAGVEACHAGAGRVLLSASRGEGDRIPVTFWTSAPADVAIGLGAVSHAYGAQRSAPVLDIHFESTGAAAVMSLVAPTRRLDGVRLDSRTSDAAWLWRVVGATSVDQIVATAAGGSVDADGISVQDGFAWLRREPSGAPSAVVAIGRRSVAVDGVSYEPERGAVVGRWREGRLLRDY
jgi:hypothetical protein